MKMTAEQIDEERRQGRLAGIAAIVGILIFFGASTISGDYNTAETAGQLTLFDSAQGNFLVQSIFQGLSILLFIPALVAFFRSVQRRNEAVRPGLIILGIVGPILLAASFLLVYISVKQASDAFLVSGGPFDQNTTQIWGLWNGAVAGADIHDLASDTLKDQFGTQLLLGLGTAGRLALVFFCVYTSLNAMRAGLTTRFWGTLGMALGVGILLFSFIMLFGYLLMVALLITRWWPSGRPPAWDAGIAIPWPKPGEPSNVQQEGDGLAAPEDFDGTATEIGDPAALSTDADPSRPGRRDNKRKRKRKQRG